MTKRWLIAVVALAGCKDAGDVRVVQRQQVPAPVVGQGVKLYVGDIELGKHAEVQVTAPNGDVLGHGDLEVGEELAFRYGGRPYVVRPKRYEDHTLHEDLAFMHVDQRTWSPHDDTVEIAENATGAMPGRPDETIAIGAIELNRPLSVTVHHGGIDARHDLSVGGTMNIESDHAEYRLVLVAVAFDARGGDHAYLRMRPGRE